MRFKLHDPAHQPLLYRLAHAEIVAVPAAIVKYRQQLSFLFGQCDQLARFLHIQRKRLIHHHMFARLQRLSGQRRMRGVGRRDHHQIDIRIGDRLLRIGDHSHTGKISLHFGGVAGNDSVEVQSRRGGKQRCVKGLSGEAVANQRHVDHCVVTHVVLLRR